jgi:hypothetical protein
MQGVRTGMVQYLYTYRSLELDEKIINLDEAEASQPSCDMF